MPATTARDTNIPANTHAGGSHTQHRECPDVSSRDKLDAWRSKYRNPFKDLRDTSDRIRNWDSEKRWSDAQRAGAVVEFTSPNTTPPFFPSFVLFAAPPHDGDEYRLRHADFARHARPVCPPAPDGHRELTSLIDR